MRPSVPTSHPALGVAKATAQKPVTSGNVYHVFPSSGVQAAPPSFAVMTTADPRLFPDPRPGLADVAKTENRAGHRRWISQRPGSTAIAGNRSVRVVRIAGIEIAAAHNPMERITKIDGECACAGRTKQPSVVGVPAVP